jgi:hypothetical protein
MNWDPYRTCKTRSCTHWRSARSVGPVLARRQPSALLAPAPAVALLDELRHDAHRDLARLVRARIEAN